MRTKLPAALGLLTIISTSLFPPWKYAQGPMRGHAGLAWISSAEIDGYPRQYVAVDIQLLLVEWLLIAILTAGVIYLLRPAKAKDRVE